MLGAGLRIPLTPFFSVTSILIYYLGFKFIGTGIHALQVAGILPATPSPYLPSSDFCGVFPTGQTTRPQVALLGLTGLWLLWLHRRPIPDGQPIRRSAKA